MSDFGSQDSFGDALAIISQANISITFLSLGIQFVLCFYGWSRLLRGPVATRKIRRPYLIAGFIILTFNLISACIESHLLLGSMYRSTSGTEFLSDSYTVSRLGAWRRASLVSLAVSSACGNAVLLYRSIILWRTFWVVLVVPALTYVAAVALSFAIAGVDSFPNPNKVIFVSTIISASFNVVATSLLLFPIICSRDLLYIASAGDEKPGGEERRSLFIPMIVESALFAALAGIGYAGSAIVYEGAAASRTTAALAIVEASIVHEGAAAGRPTAGLATSAFSVAYQTFVTLAPQLIIFRVVTGSSWARRISETRFRKKPCALEVEGEAGSKSRVVGNEVGDGRDSERNSVRAGEGAEVDSPGPPLRMWG